MTLKGNVLFRPVKNRLAGGFLFAGESKLSILVTASSLLSLRYSLTALNILLNPEYSMCCLYCHRRDTPLLMRNGNSPQAFLKTC